MTRVLDKEKGHCVVFASLKLKEFLKNSDLRTAEHRVILFH